MRKKFQNKIIRNLFQKIIRLATQEDEEDLISNTNFSITKILENFSFVLKTVEKHVDLKYIYSKIC